MSERNATEKPFAEVVTIDITDWRHAAEWVKASKCVVEGMIQQKYHVQSTKDNAELGTFAKDVKKYEKRSWADFERLVTNESVFFWQFDTNYTVKKSFCQQYSDFGRIRSQNFIFRQNK